LQRRGSSGTVAGFFLLDFPLGPVGFGDLGARIQRVALGAIIGVSLGNGVLLTCFS
jgi:hypothetical protein